MSEKQALSASVAALSSVPASTHQAATARRSDSAPRTSNRITCSGCDAFWTAMGAAHCSGCHRTFAGVVLFDRHRAAVGEHGACLDPGRLVTAKTGVPVAEFRDGMWRGPEMDEETKAKRFGRT